MFERFHRVTSSGRYIPVIDGLRFVAIASVVLYHLQGSALGRSGISISGPFMRVIGEGRFGVQLFFVISGLILGLPFASHALANGKPVSLRAYFLRRITRLEPPYVLSMIGLAVAGVFIFGESWRATILHLMASLGYVHNLIYGTNSTVNTVAWSLEVEIQFYLLMPALALLFRIPHVMWRRVAIAALAVAAVLVQTHLGNSPRFALSISNYLQFFLLGLLLADLSVTDWMTPATHARSWDTVTLAGWPLLAFVIAYTRSSVSMWTAPVIVFALYCAAFRGPISRRLFSVPWLTTIGGMCYSIYLLHYAVIRVLGRIVPTRWTNDYPLLLVGYAFVAVPVILVVSGVFFLLVERPCMRPDWPSRAIAWMRARRSAISIPQAELGNP